MAASSARAASRSLGSMRCPATASRGLVCVPQPRFVSQLASSSRRQGADVSSGQSQLLSARPHRVTGPLVQTRTLIFGRRKPRPIRTTFKWLLLAFGATFGVAYHLDSRSAIHRWIAMPVLHLLDPEVAQNMAVKLLSLGVMPNDLGTDDETLKTEIAGLPIKNPIGLAAGFDKQGEAIDGLFDLGFGMVEIGSVTPEPQPGNEKPRYFRLSKDHGAINRFGFNSDGHDVVLGRLRQRVQAWLLRASNLAGGRIPLPDEESEQHKLLATASAETILARENLPRSLRPGQLLAINLGKNKSSPEDSVEDYVKGVRTLGPYADILVINVSSPNTPGLRGMQRTSVLSNLLSKVTEARDELPRRGLARTPILVKIAPDLSRDELHDISDAALRAGIAGLIVSNTTIQRPPSLVSPPELTSEKGGLSGAPLKPLAIEALQTVRRRVGDKMAIIGCGGVFSGQDALDYARAGADAVELYTSFGYEGVGHPRRIKDELMALLHAQNTTWKASVGKGLPSPLAAKTTLPDNERETTRVGGLQDRIAESVASVKGELEEWRGLLGMTNVKASESARDAPQQGASLETVSHQPRTARPFFRPDPNDKEYVSLLDRVYDALGQPRPAEQQDEQEDAARHSLSETEKLRARLGLALQDPSVAPAAVNTGAITDATVEAGATPTAGIHPLPSDKPPHLSPVDARNQTSGAAASRYRLQMGGKPEYNSVDRQRVV